MFTYFAAYQCAREGYHQTNSSSSCCYKLVNVFSFTNFFAARFSIFQNYTHDTFHLIFNLDFFVLSLPFLLKFHDTLCLPLFSNTTTLFCRYTHTYSKLSTHYAPSNTLAIPSTCALLPPHSYQSGADGRYTTYAAPPPLMLAMVVVLLRSSKPFQYMSGNLNNLNVNMSTRRTVTSSA